jgi:hypothetical protein
MGGSRIREFFDSAVKDDRLRETPGWRSLRRRVSYLPRSVSLLEGPGSHRRGFGGLRRPRGHKGGGSSSLPGGHSPEVPFVHFSRNLLGMAGAAKRKELGADLRTIFAASDRPSALKLASSMARKWRQKGSEIVAEHLEECLSCLDFPESHRRRIPAPQTALRGSEPKR